MIEQKGRSHFKHMALSFKFRDLLSPPKIILAEAGIETGFHLLDYGCGPGGFVKDASRMVGDTGKVYALDMNPDAINSVQKIISKKKLKNIITIRTDCKTTLPDRSIDVVLLYDVFHHFDDPDRILSELCRVLKPNGTMSFSDHHMEENEIMSRVTKSGLFFLSEKGGKTYSFIRK